MISGDEDSANFIGKETQMLDAGFQEAVKDFASLQAAAPKSTPLCAPDWRCMEDGPSQYMRELQAQMSDLDDDMVFG